MKLVMLIFFKKIINISGSMYAFTHEAVIVCPEEASHGDRNKQNLQGRQDADDFTVRQVL
jgi:hypothetical protein